MTKTIRSVAAPAVRRRTLLAAGLGGVLAAPLPGFNPAINGRLVDGVNVNDAPYLLTFPYVAYGPDGRNRRHVDPGEPGGGPIS